MQHKDGRPVTSDRRASVLASALAPLLALGVQGSACMHGLRYAPARPLDPTHDAPALPSKFSRLRAQWVLQQTEASCSVASVTTVLNTVLVGMHRAAVTQRQVLEAEPSGRWRACTSQNDAEGVTLDRLGLYTLQAFYRQGIKRIAVDVLHVHDEGETAVQGLVSALEKFNRSPDDTYIIVNFRQSAYIQDGAAVGHMSVVGAYDEKRERVLILDVDERAFAPYWVNLQQLMAGMHTPDDATGEPRGYLVIRPG